MEEALFREDGLITCLLENQRREDHSQSKAGILCRENEKKLSRGQWKDLSDCTPVEL
jgi:hypothetical protein